jgi:glycolate oxidase FAD binding subunit
MAGGAPIARVSVQPTDTAAVADEIRGAAVRGTPLRIVGGGTWLDAGAPVAADATLSLGALRGVTEYVPGDLTLTARAATPLDEIARLTAAEGQILAMDPYGDASGTLGATVATASAGPLAHAFGTPRDNVIGVEFVDGTGAVIRSGGRVVKNVAGFDLARLVTGAWGTLGALTEISVRLRPRAEVDRTVAVQLPTTAALAPWLARLRAEPFAPWALELVNGPLAERLGLSNRALLLARLAGNAPNVTAQCSTLGALGDVVDVPGGVWDDLRGFEPPVAVVARVSARPSRLAALCAELFSPAAAAVGLLAHATVSRGVVRFALPGATGFGLPRFSSVAIGGVRPTIIVERMPATLGSDHRAALVTAREADRLTLGVRRAFDPHAILNPGILR